MSTVQHAGPTPTRDSELADDQARAERVAIMRRRRAALQNFGIRMVSLAIFLALWQIAAMNVDPVLFTTPCEGRGGRRRHDRAAANCGPGCGRACWCC